MCIRDSISPPPLLLIHTNSTLYYLSASTLRTQLALPLLIRLVDTIINRRLRFGYDIGKGFVVGEEELLQQFDRIVSMVPNKNIAQDLRRRVEASRLDVIRSLGEQYLVYLAMQYVAYDVMYTNLASLVYVICLLYTSPSPRDATLSRMPSSA